MERIHSTMKYKIIVSLDSAQRCSDPYDYHVEQLRCIVKALKSTHRFNKHRIIPVYLHHNNVSFPLNYMRYSYGINFSDDKICQIYEIDNQINKAMKEAAEKLTWIQMDCISTCYVLRDNTKIKYDCIQD